MARVVENHKGFLVLEISRDEMLDKLSRYGCLGICDSCNKPISKGYYIAVLNQWLCKEHYNEFVNTATRYDEDILIEEKNFKRYCKLFDMSL